MSKKVAYLLAYTLSLSTLSLYDSQLGGNTELMVFLGIVAALIFIGETIGDRLVTTLILIVAGIVLLMVSGFNYRIMVCLALYGFEILIFLISDFTFAHNRSGTLLIMITGVIESAVLIALLGIGEKNSDIYFQQWMLTKGDEGSKYVLFFIVLAMGSITFFTYSLYYLVQVRYRISLVVMISLLPCVLYAKIIAEMDNYYLVLIALFNVLAGIYHSRKESLKTSEELKLFFKNIFGNIQDNRIKRPVFVTGYAGIAVALAIILLCGFVPKKKEAIYYDQFEELFLNNGKNETERSKDLSFLNDISGNADGYKDQSVRRLYTLHAKKVTYLKRQNFDVYNFEKNYWTKADEFSEYGDVGRLGDVCNQDASIHRLLEAMQEADELCPGFLKKYGMQEVISDSCMLETVDEATSISVYPMNFQAEYYLRNARPAALVDYMGTARWYNIYVYEDMGVGGAYLKSGAGNFNLEKSVGFLEELCNILNGKNRQMEKCAQYFLEDAKEAQAYQLVMNQYNGDVPEKIYILAHEITAGCKNDYEKAYALQDYFYNDEFKYDLEYVPEDGSLEYFLFTSKTGTCSDFATAYAVMARSVGLTVRYAEGFVPTASSRQDTYYIRESGSHAYPEVYIPLLGWSVFEPTISGTASESGFFEKLGLDLIMDYALVHTTAVIIVAITIIIFTIRMLYPLFKFIIFEIVLLFTPKKDRPYKQYKYLVKKLSHKHGEKVFAMTPREFAEYYNEINKGKKTIKGLVLRLEERLYKS